MTDSCIIIAVTAARRHRRWRIFLFGRSGTSAITQRAALARGVRGALTEKQ